MMQCYAIFQGQVCKQVFCTGDSILPVLEEGSQLLKVDSLVDADMLYLENGLPIKKPEKPSPLHKWNNLQLAWELDSQAVQYIAKNKRRDLLVASDWTQLPDVPLGTKVAWATYRQELRDITDQSGYPFNIVWPTSPTS